MTNRVLLNNIDHQDLRVIDRHAPQFGDSVNQMLIFPTEFEAVQREYPIFFRKDEAEGYRSVALLGLDKNENLFLGQGGWDSRYIPAIQQRGPFSIVLQQQQAGGEQSVEPMIHIDLDDPRVSATEGVPLFLPQGGNSPYLDRISAVLRVIHTGIGVSKPMFAAFEALGLIEQVIVEIKLGEDHQYNLPDHYTISQERLAELDGAALERLHRAGYLRAAFFVLSSLANVNRIIELKRLKLAGS